MKGEKVKVRGEFEGMAVVRDGEIKILLQPPFKLTNLEVINNQPGRSNQQNRDG